MARSTGDGWRLRVGLVGNAPTLLARLRDEAAGAPIALGMDCPLGLPRAYAALHAKGAHDFPSFLRGLGARPGFLPKFLEVAATLDAAGPNQPFYPARPVAGMTRAAHAAALGLAGAGALSRACDRATAERPAGAPLFWTLGANQTGKAAIHAWREVVIPELHGAAPVRLWPFDGPFRSLLRPGGAAIAECYPAEAMRQLGIRPLGSKRRHGDRLRLVPALRAAIAALRAEPDASLDLLLGAGFGEDAAGEDRLDCVLGVLGTLAVVEGRQTDTAPDDPWIQRWEGWVLGQTALPRDMSLGVPVRRRSEVDAQVPGAAEP